MNWTKFAYHSFLTVVLGVTLSVCSNVMETDDFEIEAIANSGSTKFGSRTLSSGDNTITFTSSFSGTPTLSVTEEADNSSGTYTNVYVLSRVSNLSKTGFTYNCCSNSLLSNPKLYYSAVGN